MDRFRHIIQKQSVDVVMASEGNAFTFKDRLSELCTTKLLKEIEKLFDAKVPKNKILRADKIVIDAGELPEANWETIFIERVIEQLKNYINDVSIVTQHSTAYSDVLQLSAYGGVKENPDMKHNGLHEIEASEHASRSIFYFLETGLLPWYTSISSKTDLNEKFILLISNSNNQFFSRLLQILRTNDQAFDRVVYQLNENVLQSIIKSVGFEIDLIRSLKEFLEEIFVRMKVTSSTKKYTAYRILLRNAIDYDPNIKGTINWHEYVDSVLNFIFKRFITAGTERIISMLNESAFVAFRERSLKTIKEIQKISGLEKISDTEKITDPEKIADPEKPGEIPNTLINNNLVDNLFADSKKTNKKKHEPETDAVYISNAGLVLLHPFLPMLFENVGYFYNKGWTSNNHQQRALILTQYLITGKEEYPEFDLLLNKVVTGYPVTDSLPSEIVLSDFEKQEAADVLHSVIRHWSALKNISIEGLQSAFLMREGKLSMNESGWLLQVEQKTIDILLNRIPWSFSIVKTPWMKEKLSVEWAK